jgi:pimeloyl-ACP methyl ester carboxylesterase
VAALAVSACHGSSAPGAGGATAPASLSTPAPSSVAAAPTRLRRFYGQHLTWHSCRTHFQCTSLTVPLDYRRPSGATLRIAVIRQPASGARRGSLITNPGGPGASGVDFLAQSAGDFSALSDHYDLVSFDPRGVGLSRPVRCLAPAQLDAYVGADPVPHTAADLRRIVAQSKAFAAACAARNGSYLGHVSTLDEARDMDVLRSALGDAKLTYYGASYGTYLGAKYAQLFPTHIRAMVLDGAIDPTESATKTNLVQAEGFEADLADFLRSCVATRQCPLGSSEPAALAGLRSLIASVTAHPLPVGNRRLSAGTFYEGLAAGMYSPSTWPELQLALGQAKAGQGASLLIFSDALSGRQPDGSYTNLIEANNAINCLDRPAPTAVPAYRAAARRLARAAPVFGPAIAYGGLTCAFWPVRPVERPHPVHAVGAPPILVIGTTRDPATPYVWAQSLARQLRSGDLLTYEGDGHTAFDRGDRCVVGIVKRYVDGLVPPDAGARCT